LRSVRGGIDVRWSDFRKRPSGRVGGYKFTIEIQTVSAGVSATWQGFAVGESGSSTERSGEAGTQLAFLSAGTASSTSSATEAKVGASSAPITQAFNQLERDLKAGNVTAAQQDFSTIQQDFQNAQRAYSTLQQNFQQFASTGGSGIRSVNTTV
jgi:hypothetical protein